MNKNASSGTRRLLPAVCILFLTFISVHPFVSGAEAAQAFYAGAASVDITPETGCVLSGYAVQGGRYATGVMHHLYANIVVFSDSKTSAAVITLDLLNLHLDTVNRMRKTIESQTGIPGNHIIFASSHTHAGPLVGQTFAKGTEPKPNTAYMDFLIAKIPEGVKQAKEKMEAASPGFGMGRTNININRRIPVDGEIQMRPNPLRSVDQRVKVLHFTSTRTGKSLAALFQYPCHPNIMRGDNTLISGDFVSPAKSFVENALGGGCVALYAQGCTGNIRPNFTTPDGLNFGSGKKADVERLGNRLGREVARVVGEDMSPLSQTDIEASTAVLRLPLKQGGMVESQVQALRIGTLSIVTLPGEPVIELALRIEDKIPGTVMVFGYSNDSIGYLCTSEYFDEGGYEPTSSYVKRESDEIIVSTAVNLARGIMPK